MADGTALCGVCGVGGVWPGLLEEARGVFGVNLLEQMDKSYRSSNALIPDIWPEIQGLLQENGEMELFPAIIPLYCTVFGGVLQRGMVLMFWELYLGTCRGDSFRELLSGEYCRERSLLFGELFRCRIKVRSA